MGVRSIFFYITYFKTNTVRDITLFTCVVLRILLIPPLDTGQNTTEAENIYTNKHIWNFLRSMVPVRTFLRFGVGVGLEEIGL